MIVIWIHELKTERYLKYFIRQDDILIVRSGNRSSWKHGYYFITNINWFSHLIKVLKLLILLHFRVLRNARCLFTKVEILDYNVLYCILWCILKFFVVSIVKDSLLISQFHGWQEKSWDMIPPNATTFMFLIILLQVTQHSYFTRKTKHLNTVYL